MRFRKIESIDVIFGYYDEVCSFSWIIITKDNPSFCNAGCYLRITPQKILRQKDNRQVGKYRQRSTKKRKYRQRGFSINSNFLKYRV